MLGLTAEERVPEYMADVIFVEEFSDIDRIFMNQGAGTGIPSKSARTL